MHVHFFLVVFGIFADSICKQEHLSISRVWEEREGENERESINKCKLVWVWLVFV